MCAGFRTRGGGKEPAGILSAQGEGEEGSGVIREEKPGGKGESIPRGRHLVATTSGIMNMGMSGAQILEDKQDTSDTHLPQVSPAQAGQALIHSDTAFSERSPHHTWLLLEVSCPTLKGRQRKGR